MTVIALGAWAELAHKEDRGMDIDVHEFTGLNDGRRLTLHQNSRFQHERDAHDRRPCHSKRCDDGCFRTTPKKRVRITHGRGWLRGSKAKGLRSGPIN